MARTAAETGVMQKSAGSSPKVVLEVQDLQIGYGYSVAAIPQWTVRRGDFWMIRGANGTGKSTLLKTLAGLIPDLGGTIRWPSPIRPGYIPQSVEIHSSVNLQVLDFILLGREAMLSPRQSIFRFSHRLSEDDSVALRRLGLDKLLHRNFWNLSGGQRRRAILARTLLLAPDFLLIDEPSTGLDRESALQFYGELERLHKDEGRTILIVSHEDHYLAGWKGMQTLDPLDGMFIPSNGPEKVGATPPNRTAGRRAR